MVMAKRRSLLVALACLAAAPALAQRGPFDHVRVYLVPLADFPEGLAAELAVTIRRMLGIEVIASMRLPPLGIAHLPDTDQYDGGQLMNVAAAASMDLPGLVPSTYRVYLTTTDINTPSGNFRFQFSMHMPGWNSSVVSTARLARDAVSDLALGTRSGQRILKMIMRAIGELHLGWQRSRYRRDLMYAPLMGVHDIDRLGLTHQPDDGSPASTARHDGFWARVRDAAAGSPRLTLVAGLVLMAAASRAATARPEAELIGAWIVARPAGGVRSIAAGAIPALATALFYVDMLMLDDMRWIGAVFAILFGLAGLLCWHVFGTTFRYNDDGVELHRLLRRPRRIALSQASVTCHPVRSLFSIHDPAGQAIRFHAGWRPDAVALVNYLLGHVAAPVASHRDVQEAWDEGDDSETDDAAKGPGNAGNPAPR